jgi:ABC-type Fe3+ transport system permease subunit
MVGPGFVGVNRPEKSPDIHRGDRGESTSVSQVAAQIASSLFIGGAAIVVSGIVAFFVARRYGRGSRLKRRIIFLLVGLVGLLSAGGLMFLRLQPHA